MKPSEVLFEDTSTLSGTCLVSQISVAAQQGLHQGGFERELLLYRAVSSHSAACSFRFLGAYSRPFPDESSTVGPPRVGKIYTGPSR